MDELNALTAPAQDARPPAVQGLADGDDMFRLLVQSVPDYSIYLLDPQGEVVTWNEGARRIKGYLAGEIIGQHFENFFTPEDRAAGKPRHLLESAAREGSVHDEGWRLRSDATRFWAAATLTALHDPGTGALRGFAKVTHDETAKHEAAEALRRSEERFRLAVGALREQAFFMLSPAGIIESWNPGAELIKGYAAEEIIGQDFRVFFTAEDQSKGKPQRELEIARTMGSFEEQGWRVRKDGSRFWANVVVTAVLGERGDLRGFTKVTRDETQRHEADVALQVALDRARTAEKRVRERADDLEQSVAERTAQLVVQTEALRRTNGELEQFAYIASHDLKEPLRMITSYLDLLRLRFGGTFAAGAGAYFGKIESAATRMSELVEAVLEYSLADGGADLAEPMPLRRIVDEGLANLQQAVAESGARIVVGDLPEVHGNRVHLARVFQNLVGNAIKFRAQRPLLITIDAVANDAGWTIAVADNGIGIDPGLHGKLFRVFQRLHTREEYAGSGIGLASRKKIVEHHGGRIWIESALDVGTTFRFTLPRPA